MYSIVLMISILLALSFISIAAMVLVFATKSRVPGKKLIGFLFCGSFIYTLGYALELGSGTVAGKLFFNHLQYIGIESIAPLWFLISIQYRNRNYRWTAIKLILIFIIPVITVLLNFTFKYNGLHYASYEVVEMSCFDALKFKKGYWYYFSSAYKNVIEILTVASYYFAVKKTVGIEKKQSIMLLLLSMVGFQVTVSCYLTQYTSNIDSGAFAISISSILLLFILIKYELLDLLPLAYYSVFEFSDYPIIILSGSLRYVKSNTMAQSVFGDILKDKSNMKIQDIFNEGPSMIDSLRQSKEYIISKNINGEHIYYSARLVSLDSNKIMIKTKDFGYLLMFSNETTHINTVHNLESEASRDVLTGVFNRRYFYKHAEHIITEAKNEFSSTSVIMIDVDRFKCINDKYGHQAGDFILRAISDTINMQLRESDLFARYGGEEFIVLLSNTKSYEAEIIAERICEAVREKQFIYDDQTIKVTISAGVNTIEYFLNMSLDDSIKLADGALYQAKEDGRDRVHVA